MEFDNKSLANITANGTSGVLDVQNICDGLGVTVVGTFDSASVQTQISLDGVSFHDFGAPITTAQYLALVPCHSVRFVTTLIVTLAALVVRLGGIRSTQRND